jgi:hypothetical protein
MCYDRYTRRRQQETEQSREIWHEFDRTKPNAEPQRPEVTDPEVTELQAPDPDRAEKLTASDR